MTKFGVEEQRTPEAVVWHHMTSPGVAGCGGDYPNMAKTMLVSHVTCDACLQAGEQRPTQAVTDPTICKCGHPTSNHCFTFGTCTYCECAGFQGQRTTKAGTWDPTVKGTVVLARGRVIGHDPSDGAIEVEFNPCEEMSPRDAWIPRADIVNPCTDYPGSIDAQRFEAIMVGNLDPVTLEAAARVVEAMCWPPESLDAGRELLNSGLKTAAQHIRFLDGNESQETRDRLLQGAGLLPQRAETATPGKDQGHE